MVNKMTQDGKFIVGIVGSEAAKFDSRAEELARIEIRKLLVDAREVVSGGCHLGGIDIWAVEEAKKLNIPYTEFLPLKQEWKYYAARNMKIARRSEKVACITIAKYPTLYTGHKFLMCYHCNTNTHVKSGGCWTVKKAIELGKVGGIIVIQ